MQDLQRIPHSQTDVLGHPTMSQLNRSSSNYNWPCLLPSRDLEKMTEQSEMGLDSQVSLTKVDKSGNVKDGVWVHMNKFNLIEVQKAAKESVGWDRKSAVKKGSKTTISPVFAVGK